MKQRIGEILAQRLEVMSDGEFLDLERRARESSFGRLVDDYGLEYPTPDVYTVGDTFTWSKPSLTFDKSDILWSSGNDRTFWFQTNNAPESVTISGENDYSWAA